MKFVVWECLPPVWPLQDLVPLVELLKLYLDRPYQCSCAPRCSLRGSRNTFEQYVSVLKITLNCVANVNMITLIPRFYWSLRDMNANLKCIYDSRIAIRNHSKFQQPDGCSLFAYTWLTWHSSVNFGLCHFLIAFAMHMHSWMNSEIKTAVEKKYEIHV